MQRTGTMVAMAGLAGLTLLAGACNRSEAKKERAFDVAARRNHYEPPVSMTRAEFGGIAERRFHAMDRDGDGYLSRAEWTRSPDHFARDDADGDGRLSAEEFGHAALARFDARDSNADGTVTQTEWLAARQRHKQATATASR